MRDGTGETTIYTVVKILYVRSRVHCAHPIGKATGHSLAILSDSRKCYEQLGTHASMEGSPMSSEFALTTICRARRSHFQSAPIQGSRLRSMGHITAKHIQYVHTVPDRS